jgi:hypothetical protein
LYGNADGEKETPGNSHEGFRKTGVFFTYDYYFNFNGIDEELTDCYGNQRLIIRLTK